MNSVNSGAFTDLRGNSTPIKQSMIAGAGMNHKFRSRGGNDVSRGGGQIVTTGGTLLPEHQNPL